MQKTVAEEHPELFHYTNAAGLAGIIQSQTLWATHYAYLNDSEEIRHFLEKRFPDILQPIIHSYLNELNKLVQQNPAQQFIKIENRRINIEQEGGINEIANQLTRKTTTKLINIVLGNSNDKGLAEPYITSFCATNENSQVNVHGLLSQWRGYGKDGGYAIVFDTACLCKLLKKIGNKLKNGLDLLIGSVVYSSDPDLKFSDEFEEDLEVIKNFYEDSLKGKADEAIRGLDKSFSALMKCACRYKHWGFKEENEVRIIAIPHPTHHSQFRENMEADGIEITEISRKHYLRSGALIPYIDLFEDITSTSGKCMPIKRVIVGPSVNEQERKKRIRAVEILLRQYNISNVSVTASEIPYIG